MRLFLRIILSLTLSTSSWLALAQAPTISSFAPTSGPGGTTVTITGTNLGNVQSVVLRGIPCNITPISATSASFVVPTQASTGRFRLTTATGNALSGTDLAVTRASASLTYQLRSNAFNGIDVGDYSTPTFTDLDHDGLLDLLVGRELDGLVAHYEQSAANSTSFTLRSTNLSGLGGHYNSLVSVTDIDGDGLLELVVGSGAGNFKHYEQTALNSFAFTELANDFNNVFSAGGLTYQIPHFTDIDGDGLLDLLVGDEFLSRYEQTAANGGTFTQLNNQNFGPTPDAGNGGSASCVVDLDGDGLLDVLVGRANGQLFHHAQASAGSASFPAVSAAFSGLNLAGYTTPAIADLDGDGLLDLLVGGSDGVLRHYEQVGALITSFAPASGPVGTSITITGTNLGSATAASVNGTAGPITGTPTATSLTFTVGAGSSTGVVSLATPGGPASSTGSFTVLPPPVLTGLSPTRNARNAAVTASPAFTFDQPMGGGASSLLGVKVFSSQRGGRLQNGARGTATASGNTLTFDPANDFRPGETVFSTVTKAAVGTSGAQLLTGKVQQFTTAVGGTGRGNFRPGTDPAVGSNPLGVAVGDVDGDGDLDLATVNSNIAGTVSVRLNGGDATGSNTGVFANGTNLAVGNSSNAVVLGDVDGDGDLDLLVTNSGAIPATVSVRLNGGDATGSNTGVFSNGSSPTVSPNPFAVAVGDVDGDGDLDLLTANATNTGTVSVRLNGGDATGSNPGTFSNGSTVSVGSNPQSVAVGDVDGDGDLDLLTANYNAAGTVSVRLNGGDATGSNTGTFSNGSDVAVGNRPVGVAVADVDGDGDLDLATANQGSTTVSVRLNGGDNLGGGTGTFSNGSDVAVGAGPFGAVLADVDGDGDLDLLTANSGTGANTVSVRLNGGDATGSNTGSFAGGGPVAVGSNPRGLALADVDGDGDLDLLVANSNTSGTVSVRLNQPPAPTITSFAPASGPVGTLVTVSGTGLLGVAAATVNGTAGTLVGTPTATSFTFTVGAGSSTGVIGVATPNGAASSAASFTVLPLLTLTALSPTRNQRSAAVTASPAFTFSQAMSSGAATLGAVKVFSSQRGGRLQNGARGTATASGNTLTFNPTNDFKPGETVFSTVTTAAVGTSGAQLLTGKVQQFTTAVGGTGRGNFQPGTDPGAGRPASVAVGDVDGDGDLDFVAANGNTPGTVSVRLNDGTGAFAAPAANSAVAVGPRPQGIALGDVDGDGDLDLVTANSSTNTTSTASVRLNGGDATGSNTGVFANGSTVNAGNTPVAVALGDVDGDGDLDLLVANYNSNSVGVYLNGGDGTGSNTGTFAGGSAVAVTRPQGIALGDVDSDGDLDLLAAGLTTGLVSVCLNGGDATGSNTGVFAVAGTVAVGRSPVGLAVGDVDGDGDLDLATANEGGSSVSLRLNNGTGTFGGTTDLPVGASSRAYGVALGDVDADGDLDLVASSALEGAVVVYRNGGDASGSNTGTFAGGTGLPVGAFPAGMALADVDGDLDLDLLAANLTSGTVSVRLNQPLPAVAAASPAAELPGQAVALTGTGFVGGNQVTFGGVAASSVTVSSATSLTAVVPVGAVPGSSAVVVTTGGSSSIGPPAFEVLQVYRATAASGCLTTDPLTLTGTGGTGAWRYLRLPGAGGAVVAAVEDTRNLGSVSAGIAALGTATAAAVRTDGGANRRYLDRNFYLTAANPTFTGQTVRVRLFGLNSELTRLTAADAAATLATLNASQYDGANVNCDLSDNDPAGQRRLLAAPATALAGADWFTAQLAVADHFSEFYLTGAAAPLPVELVSFTAQAQGAAVALAWRTASERNSLRFDIERSADGRTFTKIGEAAAQGTKTSPTAYAYRDEKPTNPPTHQPTAYYRLRQVDLNGTAAYSPVRAVQLTTSPAHQLTLHPNPARTAVAVGGVPAGATVAVVDALGRTVATATADAGGTATLALPVGLAAGVYAVRGGGRAARLAVE